MYLLLRREGWRVNHKRIERLYGLLGLQLQTRRRKKRAAQARVFRGVAVGVDSRWGMDFVSDVLEDGRRFRVLTAVDLFSRECVIAEAEVSFTAAKVIECMQRLWQGGRVPQVITVDNGSEFTSRQMDLWACEHQVKLDFIRPGKPIDNAFIESFNGRLRDECLNTKVFHTIEGARQEIESWRRDYNTKRPHSAIGDITPSEYAERYRNLASEGTFTPGTGPGIMLVFWQN